MEGGRNWKREDVSCWVDVLKAGQAVDTGGGT